MLTLVVGWWRRGNAHWRKSPPAQAPLAAVHEHRPERRFLHRTLESLGIIVFAIAARTEIAHVGSDRQLGNRPLAHGVAGLAVTDRHLVRFR